MLNDNGTSVMTTFIKNQTISGDFTILQGDDVTNYGFGDLNVNRNVIINGTTNSTGTGTGSLIVSGGLSINLDTFLNGNLTVQNITNLNTTNINTNLGSTTISGINPVNISVGSSSRFVTTAGNLSITANSGSLILSGGSSGYTAVQISATNPNGSIQMNAGTAGTGNLIINTGSGGITATTNIGGPITQTAIGASFQNIITSSAAAQNLSLLLNGSTDSGIILQSAGINTSQTAIALRTTSLTGNISLNNSTSVGSTGSINLFSGGSGIQITAGNSVVSAPFQISAFNSSSSIILNTNSNSQNLTIGTVNNTNSSLILSGSGTNNAINIISSSNSGNISIQNTSNSAGSIILSSGSGGISGITQAGGALNLTSTMANTLIQTIGDNAINIQTNSTTVNANINISSLSTNINSILISSTNGGISLISNASSGGIQIQSLDPARGINIGTVSPVPISIGNTSSITTVLGDLQVLGTTTTINSTVVTIQDNIIVVNSKPASASDGGLAVKRYQSANNSGAGSLITDIPHSTGSAQGGTSVSIVLANTESNVDNFYNGYWVYIVSGTGAGQVRRIKSYIGSSRTATIYGNSDQTTQVPVEGLNYLTTPINSSVYQLFDCGYTLVIWDESNKEWAFECSVSDPSLNVVTRTHYSNLHLNQLTATNINTMTINNLPSDTTFTFTLTNNSTFPVIMTNFPSNFGVFNLYIKAVSVNSTYALFTATRANLGVTVGGNMNRRESAPGPNNEQIMMNWYSPNANSGNYLPTVNFSPAPNTGGTTTFIVKVISWY